MSNQSPTSSALGKGDGGRRAIVAGTGLMARCIAAAFACSGRDVLILGRDTQRAAAAARDAQRLCPEAVFEASHPGTIESGLLGSSPLLNVAVAVETVIEDLEVKRQVLEVLDRDLAADVAIGTNTASLSLAALATSLQHPQRLAGWHFMNPAHLTALAEVIPGPSTAPETVATLCSETKALGKTPIRMQFELPGFVWNRLIFAMWRECEHIVESGAADRASVDAAVSDGLAPRWTAGGPFVTMDLGGLDDFARAAAQVLPALSNTTVVPDDLIRAAAKGDTLCEWQPANRAATEQLRRDALATGAQLTESRRRIGLRYRAESDSATRTALANNRAGGVRVWASTHQVRPEESTDSNAMTVEDYEPDPVAQTQALLATRIRSFRQSRGLTIAALANEVGVTAAMASQIERGVTNPSMSTLVRIASALKVSIAQLFEITMPEGIVVRSADRRTINYPQLDIADEVISSDPTGQLQVLEARIGPGRTSGQELSAHGAEVECVVVLEGSIDMLVGNQRYNLHEGDALTFKGELPHGFINPTNEMARVIWVMTPATF
jgi:3-hydroxybutyryl-CoA dehydrogenase